MRYGLIAFGLIVVSALVWYLTHRPRESAAALVATYDGPIEQYNGEKTLLVAIHAPPSRSQRTTPPHLFPGRAVAPLRFGPAAFRAATQALKVETVQRGFWPTLKSGWGNSPAAIMP